MTTLVNTGGDALERYVYSPYGVLTIYDATWANVRSASSYANAYTYTGRQLDTETGLFYYRARVYAAQLGQFVGRDPIRYKGGTSLFLYVGGRPTIAVDPSGLECHSEFHHWLPSQHRPAIERLCGTFFSSCQEWGFAPSVDRYGTPIMRCSGIDSCCDTHGGFIHGHHGFRPPYNDVIGASAAGSWTCCEFLEKVTAVVELAYWIPAQRLYGPGTECNQAELSGPFPPLVTCNVSPLKPGGVPTSDEWARMLLLCRSRPTQYPQPIPIPITPPVVDPGPEQNWWPQLPPVPELRPVPTPVIVGGGIVIVVGAIIVFGPGGAAIAIAF